MGAAWACGGVLILQYTLEIQALRSALLRSDFGCVGGSRITWTTVRVMPHHRTYLHSQHLRSPFRNLYSHLSLSLVPRVTETNHLAWAVPFHPPFSISDLHSLAHCPLGGSLPASILHSRSPLIRILPFGRFPSRLADCPLGGCAVPFQPIFSIPNLHSRASTSTFVRTQSHPSLDRSLPASILHSRSPFARIYFFFCSHSIPPFLGPFSSGFHFHSPISHLRFGAQRRSATTFAEAQRWQEVFECRLRPAYLLRGGRRGRDA